MPREYGTGTIDRATDRPNTMVGEITLDGRRRRVSARITPNANTAKARQTAERQAEREVSRKLQRLIADHERGEATPDGNVTVGQLIDRWLKVGMPRDRAPSTIENNEWAARTMKEELGRKRARNLTARDVEHALENISAAHKRHHERPASRRQLVLMRATLRRVLAFAAKRGEIAGPPASAAQHAELPHDATPRNQRSALTPDRARKLWATLEGEHVGPMFQVMLLTGLRPGEAAALRWDAVDLKSEPATISVRRGLQMDGARAVITDDLKTVASRRTIAVLPEVVDLLQRQRRRIAEMRLAASSWADLDLCFPSKAGTALHPKNTRRELARIASDAGLPRVRPNELRHTAASLLSDRGVPHALIADLLGHTTTRMVDETYRHNLRTVVDAGSGGELLDLVATDQPKG